MAGKKPTAKDKGGKVGKRYPVQIKCSNTDVGNQYALVCKTIIDFFGMTIASNPTVGTRKGTKNKSTSSNKKDPAKKPALCSKGAGSIKIPIDAEGTKFKSMPVPSGATNEDLRAFLNGLQKNKPSFFISVGGRTIYINAPAKK